jgi:hypothetical protein
MPNLAKLPDSRDPFLHGVATNSGPLSDRM